MTTIPEKMCSQVTNFQFSNDLISKYLTLLFEKTRQYIDNFSERNVVVLAREGIYTHSVMDYLQEKAVQDRLKLLVRGAPKRRRKQTLLQA